MKTASQLMEELDVKTFLIVRIPGQLWEEYINRINLYGNDKVKGSDAGGYYGLSLPLEGHYILRTRVVGNPKIIKGATILTLDQWKYYVGQEPITSQEHNLYLF